MFDSFVTPLPPKKSLAAARLLLGGGGNVGSFLGKELSRRGAAFVRVIDRDKVEAKNALNQPGWAAAWHCVVRQGTGDGFDLSDPFSAEAKAKSASPPVLGRSSLNLLTR